MQGMIVLEDLRLVGAIAEEGTLTGAARRLRVDHSTAFRRLGTLEKRLGVRLFERARDGYTPTAAGEAAIVTATRFDRELSDLERKIAGQDLRPSGTVRVTTTDTLLDLVGPILARLRAEQPGLVIEVATGNEFFTLTRRDADVAVRPAASAPDGLIARRIAGVATAFYASLTYSKRCCERRTREQDWLAPDDSLSHLASARWVRAEIPGDRIVFRASSLLALRCAARQSLGVAPLPCFLADADPLLVRVHGPVPELAVSLWLITHPDLRKVARVRAVLDLLAAGLAALRPLLEGRATAMPADDTSRVAEKGQDHFGAE
jgi:DNA-binding transcriptional LysR family regulator